MLAGIIPRYTEENILKADKNRMSFSQYFSWAYFR